jgi:hypothetical protein
VLTAPKPEINPVPIKVPIIVRAGAISAADHLRCRTVVDSFD